MRKQLKQKQIGAAVKKSQSKTGTFFVAHNINTEGLFMNEITLILLFLLAFNFTLYSYAEEIKLPPVNVRINSSVNCTYCQELKKSLLQQGSLKPQIDGVYYSGELPITVNGAFLKVPIDFIELDSPNVTKLKLTTPLTQPKENYVPYLQTSFGDEIVLEGSPSYIAEALNIDTSNLNEAQKLGLSIGAFEEAVIDKTLEANQISMSQAFKSPKRLIVNKNKNFYTLKQICSDSRKNNPKKKLALVVLKTHLCDTGTLVCLKSASLISDPANKFVQDNFSVYETRFIRQGDLILNSGEEKIRSEFGKLDSNPQYYVIDVKSCSQLSSEYALNANEGIFSMDEGNRIDFNKNYKALRELLLRETKVAKLVGRNYIQNDESQIDKELKKLFIILKKLTKTKRLNQQ